MWDISRFKMANEEGVSRRRTKAQQFGIGMLALVHFDVLPVRYGLGALTPVLPCLGRQAAMTEVAVESLMSSIRFDAMPVPEHCDTA